MIALLSIALLTGCVEDVGKDKTAATVEDVKEDPKPASEKPADKAAKGTSYTVDKTTSKITALSAKITAKHPITFKDFEGTVSAAGAQPTAMQFVVTMATLEADHPKLTEHLLNEDFFHVEKFPTSTFKSTEIKAGGEGEDMTHTVTGVLEIHGQKKQVTFPAKFQVSEKNIVASTEFTINRQDFGITYKGKADDLIQDNVLMTIKLLASN